MFHINLKKPIFSFLVAAAILLTILVASSSLASAGGGSISQAKTYPQDGCTYLAIDNFAYQLSAVNPNTTVSISIDGESAVPMVFEGITNEASGDWYTWQASTPAITEPGNHTFQFFSHYYVWQDSDQYWAEFNAQSTVYSFTIKGDPSTQPTSSPTTTPSAPQVQVTPEFPAWIILPSIAITLLAVLFVRRFHKTYGSQETLTGVSQ